MVFYVLITAAELCVLPAGLVEVSRRSPKEVIGIMMGVWSFLRQFVYTKFVIVVDAGINTRDWKDVMWAVSTQMDPARDITVIENTPIDYLDFASPTPGLGGKIGLDATTKLYPETTREWGREIRMSEDIIKLVNDKWAGYGLPGSGKKIWK